MPGDTVTTIDFLTERDEFFIGGDWVTPTTNNRIQIISPSTEEIAGTVPEAREADVDTAVAAARRAFDDSTGWSSWTPAQRAATLRRIADCIAADSQTIARSVSYQNGMPISFALAAEAVAPAIFFRYFADLAENTPTEDRRAGLFGNTTVVTRRPVGVVVCIVPWNVPQAITARQIAPALAAGCSVVLKPAPETVLDAYLLAEAATRGGLPPGVLNVVPAGREVGVYLVSHPGIDQVSFTGSSAAGREVGEACGRLLRPVTLELGGKSAAVVLEDADLGNRMESFFAATLANTGQICHANTRILVSRKQYGETLDMITELARSLVVGPQLEPATQIGPLVAARQRERVEHYIQKGRADGARITVGGGRPRGLDKGWYIEPTIFADVDNTSTIAQEEIFGPVLCVIPYDDEDDAVRIANDSDFGLGGSVWSSDTEHAASVARRIESGTVGINGYAADPVAPFGGVKFSGLGRSMGPEGYASHHTLKSIYLDR